MYDALFDFSTPDAVATAEYCRQTGNESDEKVAFLRQIYANVQGQENLGQVCKLLARDAGVGLIFVEGADGPVAARDDAHSVAKVLEKPIRIAAGIEVWLTVERPAIEVIGVDDLAAEASSRAAQSVCLDNGALRESTFADARKLLHAAQQRAYPPPVAAMRRLQLACYGNWDSIAAGPSQYAASLSFPLQETLATLEPAAKSVGLDLRAYPLIARFQKVWQAEQSFSAERATAEQQQFSTRFATQIANWMTSGELDSEAASLIIEFWGEQRGISLPELQKLINTRGAEALLSEAFQFLILWLADRGQAAQTGRADAVTVMEDMLRVALRLRIPFFDLQEFRRSVVRQREAQSISGAAFNSQIEECCHAIAGSVTTPEAARLREVELQTELIYRAMRLELIPTDAETAELGRGVLASLLETAREIAGLPVSAMQSLGIDRLDDVAEAAHQFYVGSKHRSQTMARLTLEHMRRRAADRAVLVAGGFHERGITRTFEEDRRTSWSVITPTPKLN